MKEDESQKEPANRMVHVYPRAERGRHEADRCFGNSVHSEWRMPKAVLRQPNDHSQQKSRRGISPAQTEVNRYQKRKLQDRRRPKVHWQESLERQRQNDYSYNSTGIILMNFYVLVVRRVNFHVHSLVLCLHGLLGVS